MPDRPREMQPPAESPVPLLSVTRGEPTPEELAALLAVLLIAHRRAARGQLAPSTGSGWADRAAMLRRELDPGPDSWVRSTRPPWHCSL